MKFFLDFEQPVAELENKIEELRHLSDSGGINIADEVSRLQGKDCLQPASKGGVLDVLPSAPERPR